MCSGRSVVQAADRPHLFYVKLMRQATIWFCFFYAVIPFLWTFVAFQVGGYEATITFVMREAGRERPILVAALAALFTSIIWHWFGNGS